MKGVNHWLQQRYTALTLLPLLAWLCYAIDAVMLKSRAMSIVLAEPFSSVMFILIVVVSLYHGVLGMDTVIQDYVKCPIIRVTMTLGMKVVSIITGLVSILVAVRLFVIV